MTAEKACGWCGAAFLGSPRRRYCSAKCKRAPWATAHRSEMLAYWRERYRRNRSKEAERGRRRYLADRERALAYARAWAQRNPHAKRAKDVRRRARERGVEGSWTGHDWDLVLERYSRRCYYCGVAGALTVDHRIPLVRGGRNEVGNLVPACKPCNSRKGTRDELEFRAALALEELQRQRKK